MVDTNKDIFDCANKKDEEMSEQINESSCFPIKNEQIIKEQGYKKSLDVRVIHETAYPPLDENTCLTNYLPFQEIDLHDTFHSVLEKEDLVNTT